MSFIYFSAIIIFMFLCALLCFVILIQESKSTGLGASFGGDTTDSLFGTATADVLKKFTAWLAAIFLISCVLLSAWTAAVGHTKVSEGELPMIEETE
ncbi:MAG: Protein-export membrane protein SecG [Chlamydiae bacterium]|nr:Protein-export membrane protein SecG [Chlamydiota bacterium]